MNIIAIDIGNTTITAGLFLDNIEAGMEKTSGNKPEELAEVLTGYLQRVPCKPAVDGYSKKNRAGTIGRKSS